MKRIQTFRIGQVVGLGFALTLILALLIGVVGRGAYDISKQQNNIIQTRGDVGNLSQELENLAIQRTDALRRYLDTESATYLVAYRDAEVAYDKVFNRLTNLLGTPEEAQALQAIIAAEAKFDSKAQEVFRLYDSQFQDSARFLWDNEGVAVQDVLLQAIETLRQVQDDASTAIIEQARYTENQVVNAIGLSIILMLVGGVAASLFITRNITRPISDLVEGVSALSSDLTSRVEPSGPREIAFLGETINDMATSLLNSRRSLQEYNDRLERELALASQIQASFLPATLPQLPGLELAVFWKSAREVGGDFDAHVELGNGQQGIAVGDVSGKGTPAAMVGALSVGLLEAYAANHRTPETLLSELNKDLCTRLADNHMNVACCYAIIDKPTHCLYVANAGCMYPYLRRGNSLHEVSARGLPLGAWREFDYVSISLTLQPCDLIVFSSDGLVEAHNEQGELFGFERLETELTGLPVDIGAQAAVDHLVKLALDFTGPGDLHDDITVLAARIVDR